MVRDGDDRGAAADRKHVSRIVGDRRCEQRAGRGRGRDALGLRTSLAESLRRPLQLGAKPGDPGLRRALPDADLCGGLLELESLREQAGAVDAGAPETFPLREGLLRAQRRYELAVRLRDQLARAVQRDLKPVELEGGVESARAERVS